MDIFDVRQMRLRQWIDEDPVSKGNTEAWCRHYSQRVEPGEDPISATYIRQLAPRSGKRARTLGEVPARRLEHIGGKTKGWLDMLESPLSAAREETGKVPRIPWSHIGDYMGSMDAGAGGAVEEWIGTRVDIRRKTFALRVEDESMQPDFPPGMILVVEPDMDAAPGHYVIAQSPGGEATFKQLVKDGGDLYLKPMNDRYPLKPLGDSVIIGVVREAVRQLA